MKVRPKVSAIKQSSNILPRIFGGLLVFLIAVVLLLESPPVQTRLANIVKAKLEQSKQQLNLQVGQIRILPFSSFIATDVALLDKAPYTDDPNNLGFAPEDTVIYARKIYGTLSLKGLMAGGGLHLFRLTVEDASLNIVQEVDGEWPNNITRLFRSPRKIDAPKPIGELLSATIVRVRNFHFKLKNFNERPKPFHGIGIDWRDIDATAVELRAHSFRMKNGKAYWVTDHMEAYEKSGFHLRHISGRTEAGLGQTTIEKLHIDDGISDINVPRFVMKHGCIRNLKDFNEKVLLELDVAASEISSRTLAYLGDKKFKKPLLLDVKKAKADGYVSDLHLNELILDESKMGLHADVTGNIVGLGIKANKGLFAIDIKSNDSSIKFKKGNRLAFRGKVKGPCNKLAIKGEVKSGKGKATADICLRNAIASKHPIEFNGRLGAERFDVGKIIGNSKIGECSLNTSCRAVLKKGNPSIIIDSLSASSINLLGHNYEGLRICGKFSDKRPDGVVDINDSALKLHLEGSPEKFSLNIREADLVAMGLEKNTEKAVLKGSIGGENIILEDGNVTGSLKSTGLTFNYGNGEKALGDFSVKSVKNSDENFKVIVKSGFADVDYDGSRPLITMLRQAALLTINTYLPSLLKEGQEPIQDGVDKFSLIALCHDSRNLLSIIKPGAYLADSTSLSLSLSQEGELNARIKSPRLAFGRNNIKGVEINASNKTGSLVTILDGKELSLGSIKAFKNKIYLKADDDSLEFRSTYYGNEGEDYHGNFAAAGRIGRLPSKDLFTNLHVLPSVLHMEQDDWIVEDSRIYFSKGNIQFDNFGIRNKSQGLFLDGAYSSTHTDTLNIKVDSLDLEIMNIFLGKESAMSGCLSGGGIVVSPPGESYDFRMNFVCDSLVAGGSPIGIITAKTDWDEKNGKIGIHVTNDYLSRRTMDLQAFLDPTGKNAEGVATFDKFNLAIAHPFLRSLFSELHGFIGGKVTVKSRGKNIYLSSDDFQLDSTLMKLKATQVPYTLCGPMKIDSSGIHLNSIAISDSLGGHGSINGSIKIKGQDEPYLDINTKIDKLQALNLPTETDKGFYGMLSVAGNASVKGPASMLDIKGFITTVGDGRVNIPLNRSVQSKRSQLLTFKDNGKPSVIDPYDEMIGSISEPQNNNKQKGGIGIDLRTRITPQIELSVEIDKNSGNVLTAKGDASLNIRSDGKNPAIITGEYSLSGGRYSLVVPGIVSKDFSIMDGSLIRFNGKIPDTELNLNAVYKVKTSIETLTGTSSSVSSRRPVDCIISISNLITNPNIDFDVKVSDLDPTSKTQVESALSTKEKIQKQFIALLVMGMFLPDDRGSIENSTNILYSNLSQVVSGQLNSIFQKLNIPLDLGLGYQQNNNGSDIFDVAVSTQLFNNRVVVNGSVGNRRNNPGSAQNEVIGDVDVEVKLDKPGNIRLKLFSHSADQHTSFLDNAQRNGIGINYRKEFDTFGDLWYDIFSPKNKKNDDNNVQAISDTLSVRR